MSRNSLSSYFRVDLNLLLHRCLSSISYTAPGILKSGMTKQCWHSDLTLTISYGMPLLINGTLACFVHLQMRCMTFVFCHWHGWHTTWYSGLPGTPFGRKHKTFAGTFPLVVYETSYWKCTCKIRFYVVYMDEYNMKEIFLIHWTWK
jgi:hypothetical protein